MSKRVRVRFAPSPTGPLHIGGVRTALFNYLFAKKNNGHFILRIEDTDRKRYVEGAEEYIIEALEWCGIPYDEGPLKEGGYGPYRQSERQALYKEQVNRLIQKGHAYYAFDTPEELDSLRKEYDSRGETFIYNWHNRASLKNSLAIPEEDFKKMMDSNVPYVVRFKIPEGKTIRFHDEIRGDIELNTNTLDDKILFKSDGMPTYHLANVVDDHLMEISHVIRGEEWLPSLGLHFLLYAAFEWEPPIFAHLPLILKPVGKGKLSKRDGEKMGFPIVPLSWEKSVGYREFGYYPEAVINFLAMLGWNPGTDKEIFTLKELTSSFSLERVHKGGARFDPEKTKWYNHYYLQQKPVAELVEELKGLGNEHINAQPDPFLKDVVAMLKERANFVSDIWEQGDYFFTTVEAYNEKAVKKQWKEETPALMKEVLSMLAETDDFSALNTAELVKSWITEQQIGFGKVLAPLRLAIVGDLKGPDLFEIMALIGKNESIQRIKRAIEVLNK